MSHQGNITNSASSHGNVNQTIVLSPQNEMSCLQSIDAQTISAQSNKVLQFKRRRDNSKQGKHG